MTTETRFPEQASDPYEIVRTLAEVRKRPPPKDPSSLGCIVAIAALVALVLLPFLDGYSEFLPVAPLVIGIGLGVMLVERILLQRDEIYPCFTLLDALPLDDDEDLEDWT